MTGDGEDRVPIGKPAGRFTSWHKLDEYGRAWCHRNLRIVQTETVAMYSTYNLRRFKGSHCGLCMRMVKPVALPPSPFREYGVFSSTEPPPMTFNPFYSTQSKMADRYMELCNSKSTSPNKWETLSQHPNYKDNMPFDHKGLNMAEILVKYMPEVAQRVGCHPDRINILVNTDRNPVFKNSCGKWTFLWQGYLHDQTWHSIGHTECADKEKNWWETSNWHEGTYKIVFDPQPNNYNDAYFQDSHWESNSVDLKRDPSENCRVETWRNVIASFKLYRLPHCCGILVSCDSFVHPSFRSKGLGTLLNNFRQDVGRYLGYTILLCTDVSTNVPQRTVLEKNGWKDIFSFFNKRTNNKVLISVKEL